MLREYYYTVCNRVNLLIKTINRVDYIFYYANIKYLITNNQINLNIKYQILINIIDIHHDIIKGMLKHDNTVSRYKYRYRYDTDFLKKIKKMMKFQDTIFNYLYKKIETVLQFNIKNYAQFFQVSEIKSNNNEQSSSMSENLLKDLNDFKISQFNFFVNKKKDGLDIFDDFEYEDIFEKLLDRYLKRLKYVELEIIKIIYGNHIGIYYPLSEAIKNFNNYISECKREDNIYPIF